MPTPITLDRRPSDPEIMFDPHEVTEAVAALPGIVERLATSDTTPTSGGMELAELLLDGAGALDDPAPAPVGSGWLMAAQALACRAATVLVALQERPDAPPAAVAEIADVLDGTPAVVTLPADDDALQSEFRSYAGAARPTRLLMLALRLSVAINLLRMFDLEPELREAVLGVA